MSESTAPELFFRPLPHPDHASADPRDFQRLAALLRRHDPTLPLDGARLQHVARSRAEQAGFHLALAWPAAVPGGEPVAGVWSQDDDSEARGFRVRLPLDPAHASEARRRALFAYAGSLLLPREPTALSTVLPEDHSAWLAFFRDRGFAEVERMWRSRLDLARFEPPTPRPAIDSGELRLARLSELLHEPDIAVRLYRAVSEILRDVPFHRPLDIWPLEVWLERFWRSPDLTPDSSFLVLHGAEIVGLSELRPHPDPDTLQTGLTGVRAPYRRRGLAAALKIEALRHARAGGARWVVTNNHSGNRAMLALNERLGFVREVGVVTLRKALGGA